MLILYTFIAIAIIVFVLPLIVILYRKWKKWLEKKFDEDSDLNT